MIAERTCPKCGTVSTTGASACPLDGTSFAEPVTGRGEKQAQTTLNGSQSKDDSRDSRDKHGVERTLPTGTTVQNLLIDAQVDKPYLSNDVAAPRRINNRLNTAVGTDQSAVVEAESARDSAINSLVGQVLDNQYQILSLIGQGGMSVVYKARHNMLRKVVAIKTMLPHLVQHPMSLQRFQQEAQAASNIVHTNVITIYNFGITPEGQPYLVMDYLEGTSLAELVSDGKFLPVERATNIFLQVSNALAHAHAKGVIHRDLKPSNIILIEQGEKKDVVQIVDFGIAKMLPQDGEQAMNLTQTGEVFGSPLYMSPEQCKGEKLDHRADIYSMGCLMYETLTGGPPLHGDNTLEVLYKHINEMPRAMSSREHPVPARLEAIVFKALAKQPADRYQTMDDLEKDLNSFQKTQQFSLISFFKSRWELSRLKRLPRTKRERAATIAVTLSCIATLVATILPTVKYLNLPNEPIAKSTMLLDDDRREESKVRDEINNAACKMAIDQAQDYLSGKSIIESPATLYGALMHHGKYYSDTNYFPAAYRAFDMAVKFSTKVNGADAIPTLHALLEKGDVAYYTGLWDESVQAYKLLVGGLSHSPSESMREAFYSARAANCYWNLQKYELAKPLYVHALKLWDHPAKPKPRDGLRSTYSLSREDAFAEALADTRLGMIYERDVSDRNIAELLPDYEKKVYEEQGPQLLFKALPLWRTVLGESSKNVGICEIQLAQSLQNNPAASTTLTRKPLDGEQDKKQADDKDVEKLYAAGTKALKNSCGEGDLNYALGMLSYANYLWKHHDYKAAIDARLEACQALSKTVKSKQTIAIH